MMYPLRGSGCENVRWIELAEDCVQWRALLLAVLNLQVLLSQCYFFVKIYNSVHDLSSSCRVWNRYDASLRGSKLQTVEVLQYVCCSKYDCLLKSLSGV